MNTTQLECFLSVAQHLNFSKAAEEINITQPAVSHQISSLETELDTKLFIRTSKSVTLTEDGMRFITDAESIMKTFAEAKSKMSERKKDTALSLSIGAHNSAEFDMLPPILNPLCKEFPSLSPTIRPIPFKALENLLNDNKIQILLGLEGGDKSADISYAEFGKYNACVVCRKDYAPISAPTLTINNIIGRIILGEPHKIPPVIYELQKQILENRNSDDMVFGDDFESVNTLMQSGIGFCVAPDIPLMRKSNLKYIPITDFPPISVGLYYKKDKNNLVLNRFIETAQKVFSQAL